MTRTQQVSKKSEVNTKQRIIKNEKNGSIKSKVDMKKKRKKPNTPFSFAKERIKLVKKDYNFWRDPFERVIREITQDMYPTKDYRYTKEAIDNIQILAENYLLKIFDYANLVANHSKRPTLMLEDMHLGMYFVDAIENEKYRPLTIHEKEFFIHKEKNRIKKEKHLQKEFELNKIKYEEGALETGIKTEKSVVEDDEDEEKVVSKTTSTKSNSKKSPVLPKKKTQTPSTTTQVVDINSF